MCFHPTFLTDFLRGPIPDTQRLDFFETRPPTSRPLPPWPVFHPSIFFSWSRNPVRAPRGRGQNFVSIYSRRQMSGTSSDPLAASDVQLPVHADVGSVELDVSADCAELSLVAGAEAGSLRVPLPHRVDPSRAGPAKYHRTGAGWGSAVAQPRTSSRLVLELPRAAHI
ncbi:unnamed protein product [Prorocentrum cordatum]|uniref:PIH1D1/2/3 CS-like domain-containing protein n=1 Tax=Prorocentrum cordatum TaxID=2364126 RepID=A0ABN9QJT2_9DINO|nr:unnamed protein product [Polarella glacialis]